MHIENELTVEVDTSYQNLLRILKKNNFKVKEEFDLKDLYLIHKKDKRGKNYLSLLNKCILIRSIISKDNDEHYLTYKYKEYFKNGDIKKQSKINCKIDNPKDMQLIFEQLGFEALIKIDDHMLIMENDTDEMGVQFVNDNHLYIEIELSDHYASLEEIKEVFTKYNIPIKDNNYYAKKAEIALKEKYENEAT